MQDEADQEGRSQTMESLAGTWTTFHRQWQVTMVSSKGLVWLSLHLRKSTVGAAGLDGFQVTGAKTSYKAVTGPQVRDSLSLIPCQSLFLNLNKILAFSYQSIYHSPNRITRPIEVHIDPNPAKGKFHTSQDHSCL